MQPILEFIIRTQEHRAQPKTRQRAEAEPNATARRPSSAAMREWRLRCLRPLSTDSCFLTKPTLLRADPMIMKTLLWNRGQPGSDVNSSELTSWTAFTLPCSEGAKAAPRHFGRGAGLSSGGLPVSKTKTEHLWCRGLLCFHIHLLINMHKTPSVNTHRFPNAGANLDIRTYSRTPS